MNPTHRVTTLLGGLFFLALPDLDAQGSLADYERAKNFGKSVSGKVFLDSVNPNWFDDDRKMWYRRELRGVREFILVDCEKGTRRPAFNHGRLAAALAEVTKKQVDAKRLPFRVISLHEKHGVVFQVSKTVWGCDLKTYACTKLDSVPAPKETTPPRRSRGRGRRGNRGRRTGEANGRRPTKREPVTVREFNLFVGDDQLTTDGREANYYEAPKWSPDGGTLVAFRTVPGNVKEVPLIESSPRGQLVAKFRVRKYARPGDRFESRKMFLFDPKTKKRTAVQTGRIDFGRAPRLRWSKDGKTFTFQRTDRGHKRFRVFEVTAATGATRTVLDENTADYAAGDTFINSWGSRIEYLRKSEAVIYLSERDGWKHFYHVDIQTGKRRQITKGEWVVRGVDRLDEDKQEIWFRASGKNKGQDPYYIHHYRVSFDGTNLVALTEGDGTHRISYSPTKKYLIDTWSRVDMASSTAMRRVSDGARVCDLEHADIRDLLETGWRKPEPFRAKSRDGNTDIYGVIFRPRRLDKTRKYPIIEDIYAGPHDSFVPKNFSAGRSQQALCELGFIVVKIDGMGTNNRSKAFHDKCWKNVGGAGLKDRIAWIKAAAAKYPYMDDTNVGIFGTSAGGQSSTGAVLFHPDFYKVAVSSCGCHDNRLDKASWNEQWMGYPVGPHYEAQSNITNAHKLQGKLFLIVGELDTNVPPESTMRVVDALIRADKDFDLLVIPGSNHTSGGRYGSRRRKDFFVRHLLHVEPRWEKR